MAQVMHEPRVLIWIKNHLVDVKTVFLSQ